MDKIVMTKSWRNMQVPYPTARLLPFLPPFFTLLYPGALIPMLLIIGEFLYGTAAKIWAQAAVLVLPALTAILDGTFSPKQTLRVQAAGTIGGFPEGALAAQQAASRFNHNLTPLSIQFPIKAMKDVQNVSRPRPAHI